MVVVVIVPNDFKQILVSMKGKTWLLFSEFVKSLINRIYSFTL